MTFKAVSLIEFETLELVVFLLIKFAVAWGKVVIALAEFLFCEVTWKGMLISLIGKFTFSAAALNKFYILIELSGWKGMRSLISSKIQM